MEKILKNFNQIIKVLSLIATMSSLPLPILAQWIPNAPALSSVISRFFNILWWVMIVVAVGGIILGGYKMTMAGGSSEQLETGRKIVLFAVAGLIIVGAARAIVSVACYIATGSADCSSPY